MTHTVPKIIYASASESDSASLASALPKDVVLQHVLSAQDCLALAKQFTPHMVILKTNLSDISCQALCHQLKTSQQTQDIPVLIVSHDEAQDLTSYDANGIVSTDDPINITLQFINRFVDLEMNFTPMQVLVVDDDTSMRNMLTHYIEEMGHKTVAAANGEEAIAAFKKETFDLVITDVEMPELDGFEATQAIRAFSTNWLPIIFVSNHRDDTYIEKAINSGADDYLYKPLSFIMLRAKVQSMARIAAMRKELEQANAALHRLSHYDPLTNIYNRRAYEENLDREWRRMKRDNLELILIIIDIDYFKKYNDHYGHQAGDDCLHAVAQSLSDTLQRPSDLIARYGGEEFTVVLPHTTLQDGLRVAEKLQHSVATLNIAHQHSSAASHITLSMGLCSSLSCDNPETLFKYADIALYRAKEAGRNCIMTYENNHT